ncbi:MAG: peptidylprolyl isomerase [Frankia sp.]|nr:peptidylprolyl isomerase [Frankia sp.]
MRRRSRATALVSLLLTGAAIVGCGRGHAGLAASVGSTRITTDDLGKLVQRALANEQFAARLGDPATPERATQTAAFQRQVLARLISRVVLQRAAARAGVVVTEGDVDARLQAFVAQAGNLQALETDAAQNGLPREEIRNFIRDEVVRDKLRDKLTADQRVTEAQITALYRRNIDRYQEFHVAHILVSNAALATRLVADARRDPRQFAALARRYSTDTSNKAKGGDLGTGPAGRFVAAFRDAVLAARPGSIVGPVKTEFGYHVVRVIGKRVLRSLAQVRAELRAEVLQTVRDERLGKLLADVTAELKVRVNPRFGRWDAKSATLLPPPDDLSSPASSPAADLTAPPAVAPSGP